MAGRSASPARSIHSPISFAFLRAAQEAGIPFNGDFNGAVQDGIGHYQLSTRTRWRSSTASSAFLKPARGRKQSHRAHQRADAEDRRRERPRGRGRDRHGRRSRDDLRADREVIVSCGAIGSPRLLQLSGIGPADALKKAGVSVVHDLPGVGSNMQDHLDLYAIAECTGDHTYDRVARPHRTIWAGLAVSVVQDRPGDLDAVRDRRLLVRGPGSALARHSVPSWASDRGSRRASRR